MKEIFKKYGWTLKALFLVAGTVIGAVLLYLITTLKMAQILLAMGLWKSAKRWAPFCPANKAY